MDLEEKKESLLYEEWISMRPRSAGAEEEKNFGGGKPLIQVLTENSDEIGIAPPRTWPLFVESEPILDSVANVGISEEVSQSAEFFGSILNRSTNSLNSTKDKESIPQVLNLVEPKNIDGITQEPPVVDLDAVNELAVLVGDEDRIKKKPTNNIIPSLATPRTPPPTPAKEVYDDSRLVATEILDEAVTRATANEEMSTSAQLEAAMRELEEDVAELARSAMQFEEENEHEQYHTETQNEEIKHGVDLIVAAAEASIAARNRQPPDAAQPALDATMLAVVANADGPPEDLAEPLTLAHPGIKHAIPPKPPAVPEEIFLQDIEDSSHLDLRQKKPTIKKHIKATTSASSPLRSQQDELLWRRAWSAAYDEQKKQDQDEPLQLQNEENFPARELETLVDSCLRREHSSLTTLPSVTGISVRSQPRAQQQTEPRPVSNLRGSSVQPEPILNTGAIYNTFHQRLQQNDSKLLAVLNHSRAVLNNQAALFRVETAASGL